MVFPQAFARQRHGSSRNYHILHPITTFGHGGRRFEFSSSDNVQNEFNKLYEIAKLGSKIAMI
jgi:hypothetical protein